MLHLIQPGVILRQMCVWYRMAQAGPPHDGKAPPGQRGHLSLQVRGACSGVSGLMVKWEARFSLGNDPIEALLKTKKSIHPGPFGQLKPLKEALLKYIFKQRKQGIKVSTLSIIVVASNISTEFGEKDFIARCSTIKHFVRAHLLVYQMGTHLCQRKPEEVETEASSYMHLIRTLLFGPHCDRHFILNMDQMPVYF
jgi:hypothetical protein